MNVKNIFLVCGLTNLSIVLVASDSSLDRFSLSENSYSSETLIARLEAVSAFAGWGLPTKDYNLDQLIDHMKIQAQKARDKNLRLAHELGRIQGLIGLSSDKKIRNYSPISSLRYTAESLKAAPVVVPLHPVICEEQDIEREFVKSVE